MFFLLHMFCKHSSHSGSLILLRKTKSHRQTLEIHVLGEKKKKQQWSMSITLNTTIRCKKSKQEMFLKEQLGQKLKGCSETLCQYDTPTQRTRDDLTRP